METFHFLRPEWFYALIPAALLFVLLKARQARSSNWALTIDPGLLPHLLEAPAGKAGRRPLTLLLVAWMLATIALAGPTFRKIPQPVHEREDALVILLDLTRSMYATDLKPNRLVAAQRKLQDVLAARDEGVTALVVWSGDAHTVTPLTDDTNTINEMIHAVSPEIMPAPGSQLAPALELAIQLFRDAGAASGRILIITDEIRDIAESQAIAREYRQEYPVSVLGVGRSDGAPVELPTGGYLKDATGALVIPRLPAETLRNFAAIAGGRFAEMTITDGDIDYLLADQALPDQLEFRAIERDFDIWIEEGPWLLLFLLPLAALAFRRGWLWILLVVILPGERAEASLWDDLWQTRDQQGIEALKRGEAADAAALFRDPAWKGTAHYRGQDFEAAAAQYRGLDTPDAAYNLGNALARQRQYSKAIEAYDEALARNPDNEDAAFNKRLVEELLQQQQQQEQDQEQQQQQQDQQQGDENQQQDSQQSQDQDQQEQQQAEQEQGEEEGEQQSEEQQAQSEQEDAQERQAQEPAQQEADKLDEEQQQALEQWLRRVPDDPGGLLRRKFQLQHDDRAKRIGRARDDQQSDW